MEVSGRGSTNGDPAIAEVGDVDTAVALATLEDGTVATGSATRYNGAGHADRSAESGVSFPAGPAHQSFHQRFAEAYRQEMRAFMEVVRGQRENPCPPEEAVDDSWVADATQESLETGRPVRVQR